NVTVKATFSEDSVVREYSLDGGQTWKPYDENGIIIIINGTVDFRGTDAAGNLSEVTSYTVGNIDKIAPNKPVATADITTLTNTDVVVSATFSDDSIEKEYSLDGQTWKTYTEAVKFTANGTICFRGIDAAGNISEAASYTVSNIDKVAPNKPVATADITALTNTDVLVSAAFSEDTVKKEYSLDGTTWRTYSDAILFMVNGTAYFRGTDAAGNVSEVTNYTVSNIDKVAPDKPIAMADITSPTNTSVRVSAIFNEKSIIREYSLNGIDWLAYTGSIELADNGTVYFRSEDAAGNVSEVTSYEVTNIDKVAPEKPTASSDVTALTNGDVTVTAAFSADSVTKEYSLDGQTWQAYIEAVKFTDNGNVYFRGTDAAGNISEVTTFEVTNIDKVAPEKPVATADITTATNGDVLVSAVFSTDSVSKEYSLDGQTWQTYTDAVKFTENGTVYFRGTDAAGNVSEIASYAVTNIETVIPDTTKPTVSGIAASTNEPTSQAVTITAVFADDVALASSLYRIGEDGEWLTYVDGVTVGENTAVYFKAVDASGNESEVV
ncbi:MAG: hypothetical protein J6Y26_01865, partial [Lachnospiraceae bacterium]|nr:hypothetical protein [Lachnospiraceae bacterium]